MVIPVRVALSVVGGLDVVSLDLVPNLGLGLDAGLSSTFTGLSTSREL